MFNVRKFQKKTCKWPHVQTWPVAPTLVLKQKVSLQWGCSVDSEDCPNPPHPDHLDHSDHQHLVQVFHQLHPWTSLVLVPDRISDLTLEAQWELSHCENHHHQKCSHLHHSPFFNINHNRKSFRRSGPEWTEELQWNPIESTCTREMRFCWKGVEGFGETRSTHAGARSAHRIHGKEEEFEQKHTNQWPVV